MVGPTWWFGEEEGEEPDVYVDAVFEETSSPGLQVLVNDRSRVKDIVNSCLPTLLSGTEDGEVEPTGRWCRLNGISEDHDPEEDDSLWDQWRMAASEVTDIPTPEFTTMVVEANETLDAYLTTVMDDDDNAHKIIATDAVLDRMQRELAAIDWCLNSFREEGELYQGELVLNVTLTKKGRTNSDIDEESEVQDSTAMRCASKRWGKLKFTVPKQPKLSKEEKEELANELEKLEKRGKEPPPRPGVIATFQLDTPPEFQEEEE